MFSEQYIKREQQPGETREATVARLKAKKNADRERRRSSTPLRIMASAKAPCCEGCYVGACELADDESPTARVSAKGTAMSTRSTKNKDGHERHVEIYGPKHPTHDNPTPNHSADDDDDEEEDQNSGRLYSESRITWPDVESAALTKQTARAAKNVDVDARPVRISAEEARMAALMGTPENALLARKVARLREQALAKREAAAAEESAASPALTVEEKRVATLMGLSHEDAVIAKAKRLQKKGA